MSNLIYVRVEERIRWQSSEVLDCRNFRVDVLAD